MFRHEKCLPWKELYRRPEIIQHKCFQFSYSKFRHSNHPIGAPTCTNHTVPYGTALWGGAVPGTSCQATIAPSLRDISQQALARPEGPTRLEPGLESGGCRTEAQGRTNKMSQALNERQINCVSGPFSASTPALLQSATQWGCCFPGPPLRFSPGF